MNKGKDVKIFVFLIGIIFASFLASYSFNKDSDSNNKITGFYLREDCPPTTPKTGKGDGVGRDRNKDQACSKAIKDACKKALEDAKKQCTEYCKGGPQGTLKCTGVATKNGDCKVKDIGPMQNDGQDECSCTRLTGGYKCKARAEQDIDCKCNKPKEKKEPG